ncbi:hypothetical protein HPB49_022072 [Dermacentor silvarum]|uniref:Uncharacterized protein n=1 Tax=Dermacentor silvarum TaxID=543639 RepID=A0ACB8D0B0_DERSI|nr:hypothetical protein HPB49_022072 [Dermacentor silvarum]
MPGTSLTPEEALELFFSLPGDSESSGNEAESSDSDFVPEIAPAESSQESDNIDTQPTRKRKRLQRKKRKSKQPADASELRDEGSDKSEAEEVEPSLWSTSEPLNIVRSPKIWDPQFSSKVPTNAAEAFALYFTDDLLDVIIEHTNREGARKYGRKWSVLSMQELKAYFGDGLHPSLPARTPTACACQRHCAALHVAVHPTVLRYMAAMSCLYAETVKARTVPPIILAPLRKQLTNQHGYQHKLRISRHRQMPQIACNNAPKAPTNDSNEKTVSTSQPGDHSAQSLPPVSRPTNDSAEVAKTPSSPKPSSGSSLDFNGRQ